MKRLFSRLLTRLGRRAARAPVTLQLTSVPANTPAGATIYLTGSVNGWTTDDPACAFSFDPGTGSYFLTLPPGRGTLDYKFCRGSWATIETDAENRAVPNRRYLYGQGPRVVAQQVLNWEDQGGIIPPRQHSASPNVHILSPEFAMPQLRRTRRVWVYLPPGYAEGASRYPVLYLQDGQNVFDQYTSFAGEWGVDETLDALAARGQDLGGCLVVAVDNSSQHRLAEYSPWRNPRTGRGGEGGQYVDFLVDTLKPYIDHHYRTRPGRETTGILGSSMGGLLATYAALRYPAVFGRVGVFSPAYWFAGPALLGYLKQQKPRPDTRWYFVCGAQEGPSMAPLMTAVHDALGAAGVPGTNLSCQVLADGQHAEWFWQREFAAAYRWLFADLPTAASPSATTLG
ncbi:alpha/beta hydrolase [Hymenobacter cheonanensis]|uniref:alpha/beta hydrolase n=1 Tax=Hymenobacter sp. CA2-7 TaxID=3063993 RepID=UPI002712EF4C|nr:alpha/beta hydrolase-fold protein [Hymenobacter sp. CA2-7]MDO7885003.1 alpha/beta hydrolase-fold protein [Hymenobacter sp. CA2-7]